MQKKYEALKKERYLGIEIDRKLSTKTNNIFIEGLKLLDACEAGDCKTQGQIFLDSCI